MLLLERSDNMWILETRDGDRWSYDENELENARRDKYIFGGEISHVEDKVIEKFDKKYNNSLWIIGNEEFSITRNELIEILKEK